MEKYKTGLIEYGTHYTVLETAIKSDAVCLLLPAALAGGAVSAAAPQAAVYGLCTADPCAWMAADAVLLYPFVHNILKQNYDYLYTGSAKELVSR